MASDQKTVDRPLPAIAEAFKELEDDLNKGSGAVLRVRPFSHACSLISILFGYLGMAFKFAEKDYVSKVRCHEYDSDHCKVQSFNPLLQRPFAFEGKFYHGNCKTSVKLMKSIESDSRSLLACRLGNSPLPCEEIDTRVCVTLGKKIQQGSGYVYRVFLELVSTVM